MKERTPKANVNVGTDIFTPLDALTTLPDEQLTKRTEKEILFLFERLSRLNPLWELTRRLHIGDRGYYTQIDFQKSEDGDEIGKYDTKSKNGEPVKWQRKTNGMSIDGLIKKAKESGLFPDVPDDFWTKVDYVVFRLLDYKAERSALFDFCTKTGQSNMWKVTARLGSKTVQVTPRQKYNSVASQTQNFFITAREFLGIDYQSQTLSIVSKPRSETVFSPRG